MAPRLEKKDGERAGGFIGCFRERCNCNKLMVHVASTGSLVDSAKYKRTSDPITQHTLAEVVWDTSVHMASSVAPITRRTSDTLSHFTLKRSFVTVRNYAMLILSLRKVSERLAPPRIFPSPEGNLFQTD